MFIVKKKKNPNQIWTNKGNVGHESASVILLYIFWSLKPLKQMSHEQHKIIELLTC